MNVPKRATKSRKKKPPHPLWLSVPEAGWRFFGLSRNGAYAAAARGELPVIKIGKRMCCPVIVLERMLAETAPKTTA